LAVVASAAAWAADQHSSPPGDRYGWASSLNHKPASDALRELAAPSFEMGYTFHAAEHIAAVGRE